MQHFTDLAPYIVPLVSVLLAALFGPSIRSVARYRRDLSADAAIVESLPEPAKEALRTDMGRRTMELITYSRHPTLTVSDLLAIVALVAGSIFFAFGITVFARSGWAATPVLLSGISFVPLMATVWLTFHNRWTDRAADRLRALHVDVGRQQAAESGRLIRVASHTSGLGGAILIGAGVPISIAISLAAWHRWAAESLLAATFAGVLVGTFGVLRLTARLSRDLNSVLTDLLDNPEPEHSTDLDASRRVAPDPSAHDQG